MAHQGEFFTDSDCVLFIGSGVSSVPNYNGEGLPSGSSVSKLLMEFLRPKDDELCAPIFDQDIPFEQMFNKYPKKESLKSIFSKNYSSSGFYNVVHEAIAKKIKDGSISAVITTNYDDCLEYVFEKHKLSFTQIIEEQDFINLDPNTLPVFKIHGCVSNPPSIIATINEEGELHPWKLRCLSELVTKKHIRILGYSGLDFDICPFLFSSNLVISSIIWQQRDKKKLKLNAKKASAQRLAKIYEIDFTGLFNLPVQPQDNSTDTKQSDDENKTSNAEALFNEITNTLNTEEKHLWRFDFYNDLTAAKAMAFEYERYQVNDPVTRLEQLSEICERTGRYLDGVDNLDNAREILLRRGEYDQAMMDYLTTVGRYYTAGYLTYGVHRLLIAYLSIRFGQHNYQSYVEASLNYLLSLFISTIPYSSNTLKRQILSPLLNQASKHYYTSGEWQKLYLCKNLAEKHGLLLELDNKLMILSAQQGFSHISNYIGSLISQNNSDALHGTNSLSTQIQNAYECGLYPVVLILGRRLKSKNTALPSYEISRIKTCINDAIERCQLPRRRKKKYRELINSIY